MAQKPKIEYVGRSYLFGSEAPKIEEHHRTLKSLLPAIKLERFRNIYIDPVGLLGLTVAVVLLVMLVAGALQMRQTRAEYDAMKTYLSDLKRENAQLSHAYHTSYDLDEIREQAEKIGMVDGNDTERFTVIFSVPEHQEEPSAWDEFVWLISGLLSNPKRADAS